MLKYGVRASTLEEAAGQVGAVLKLAFQPHSSAYRGGDYFRAEVPEGAVYLQRNFDTMDDEPFELTWPPDQFLLCFDGLDDEEWSQRTELLAPLVRGETAVFLKKAIS
jgi:hypothetical protein